ncbi:alpha/beta fold hydrolase [Shewanella sp.]|uniref:alpha/beta fold hydrolase n=1 Tax=Shewanella sp. TaxID=50422 RepID=UPI003A980757
MTQKFLLVHGAWQGQWAWKNVAKTLKNEGHEVLAIDLPGSGNSHQPASQITLAAYAEAIVASAKALSSKGDVILVGHSMGGAAVTAAASISPLLFAKIIYVCAFLPQDGESVAMLGEESKRYGTAGPQTNIDKENGTLTLDSASIKHTFFNDYTGEQVEHFIEQFRPQPLTPLITPIALTPAWHNISKAYIVCQRDNAISPKLQRLMAQRANIHEIEYLDAGHEPFFSCPDKLTSVLIAQGT